MELGQVAAVNVLYWLNHQDAQPHQRFAYCVMYMCRNEHVVEPDLYVKGWATKENFEEQLAGTYEQIKDESGEVYAQMTLPPGEFFDDMPPYVRPA